MLIHNTRCIIVTEGPRAFMTCTCESVCVILWGVWLLRLYLHVRMPEARKTVGILVFPR